MNKPMASTLRASLLTANWFGCQSLLRLLAFAALCWYAAETPELLTKSSLISILDSAALIGLVALGMAFITISGNLLSVALGATMGASSITFMATTGLGVSFAVFAAIVTSIAISALQGWVIGYLRANAIVVSIAALSLLTGIVTQVTGGAGIFAAANADLSPLKMEFGPVNITVFVFLAAVFIAQVILSRTTFGYALYLVGSNPRASDATGIRTGAVMTGAYAIAGAFCGIAGIMAAARFATASLETGFGYDYDAIAIIMLGGVSMHGGHGSAFHVLLGAIILSTINTILVLNGASQGTQRVMLGVLVLGAICLNVRARR